MKKSFSFVCKAMAAAFLLAAPMFVTSCGDDDDNDQPNKEGTDETGTKPYSVKVAYDLTLEQPWFDCFDIIRTVVDENGTTTDTMTVSSSYTCGYSYATAPSVFKLYLVAKPKANVHDFLKADQEYCFDHDLSVSVMAYSKEGLEVPFMLPSSGKRQIAADSVYVKGSDFDNYVEALTSTSQKDTIFKAEYTIK